MTNFQDKNTLISDEVFKMMGVEEGMMVGDLGCGNIGYFSLTIAKLIGKKGVVFAVDILKSALNAVDNKIAQDQ